MPDSVLKIKYEQLKTTLDTLQGKLLTIQQDMFDIGVQLGVMLKEFENADFPAMSFNDKVTRASRAIKPKSPFDPIKRRSLDMTPIIPHPIDKASAVDTEGGLKVPKKKKKVTRKEKIAKGGKK